MKLNGIFGKGSGKVGESVWAVSGGVQIVRPYNPNVSNPQTPAQMEQRAKFKLMSQIAADLASVIAIPKDGLKSSRNLFVSKNIGLVEYERDNANVMVTDLQLTPGTAYLPGVVTGGTSEQFQVHLESAPSADVDAVAYILLDKDGDDQLIVKDTALVTEAGAPGTFVTVFDSPGNVAFVLAYGVKSSAAGAGFSYENYSIDKASDLAKLFTARTIKNASGALTKTVGLRVTQ